MRKQKGFTFIEFLIVISVIVLIVVIAIPALQHIRFSDRFGFYAKPATPLKRELVREHVNVLERACVDAMEREHTFSVRPVALTPDHREALELWTKAQTAQTNSVCRLHTDVVQLAHRHGYGPTEKQ